MSQILSRDLLGMLTNSMLPLMMTDKSSLSMSASMAKDTRLTPTGYGAAFPIR